MPVKVKISLFIPSLALGGSERQLIELAKGLDKSRWDVSVMTIYEGGALLEEANSIAGIKIISLRKNNAVSLMGKLLHIVRKENIDVLFCFLNTSQAYALLAKFFLPDLKLVCRIGDAIGPGEYFGYKNAFVNFILKACKNNADYYIFNSQQGLKAKALSVPAGRAKVVHNGIDTNRFQPSHSLREQSRRVLGLAEGTVLVGHLGNVSIYKDHKTFVHAAGIVIKAHKDVHFLTIGNHDTVLGQEAISYVKAMGMGRHFTFLGPRKDVEKILPALDIGCSSSMTEGFPNCICELMACAVPCVVTDVGDSKLIVADTGLTVPSSDPGALAQGIMTLLQLPPRERSLVGYRARQRIVENYSATRMVCETEKILKSLLSIQEK